MKNLFEYAQMATLTSMKEFFLLHTISFEVFGDKFADGISHSFLENLQQQSRRNFLFN